MTGVQTCALPICSGEATNKKGVDVNTKDETERTALHLAAEEGHKPVARLLVEKGADIYAKNIRGRTVLYLAAEGGHKAVARLLVEK